jgi:hypothetical protein
VAIARGSHVSIEWRAVNDGAGQTTGTIDTTGMNLITVGVTYSSGLTSITDNKSNTYTLRAGPVSAGDKKAFYDCQNPTVGAGHTFTATPTGGGPTNNYGTLEVASYSGIAASSPIDQTNTRTQLATTDWDTNNVTTTQADELLVSVGTLGLGTSVTFTAQNSFTMQEQHGNGASTSTGYLMDQIVAATGTYTGHVTSDQSGDSAAIIVTYKAAGGGGGGAVQQMLMMLGVGS